MATKPTITIKFRWWVVWYVRAVCWFASVTGTVPDYEKLRARLSRWIFAVDSNGRRLPADKAADGEV